MMLGLRIISATITTGVKLQIKLIVYTTGYIQLNAIQRKISQPIPFIIMYLTCSIIGNFTSQERKRVLGQSSNTVFRKHYQSQFIQHDLQHVILLRLPQEGLLRLARSMLRKRDPLAPSSELSAAQRRAVCQGPEILELRREKRLDAPI